MAWIPYGKVGTSEWTLFDELYPWETPEPGWIIMQYNIPVRYSTSGEWIAQSDGTWVWTPKDSEFNVKFYQGNLYGRQPSFGGPERSITAADLGFASTSWATSEMAGLTADYVTKIAVAKGQATAQAATDAAVALAAYDAQRPALVVTTDSSGNFTVNVTPYNYSVAPVVSSDVEGAGGYVVNLTGDFRFWLANASD